MMNREPNRLKRRQDRLMGLCRKCNIKVPDIYAHSAMHEEDDIDDDENEGTIDDQTPRYLS